MSIWVNYDTRLNKQIWAATTEIFFFSPYVVMLQKLLHIWHTWNTVSFFQATAGDRRRSYVMLRVTSWNGLARVFLKVFCLSYDGLYQFNLLLWSAGLKSCWPVICQIFQCPLYAHLRNVTANIAGHKQHYYVKTLKTEPVFNFNFMPNFLFSLDCVCLIFKMCKGTKVSNSQ